LFLNRADVLELLFVQVKFSRKYFLAEFLDFLSCFFIGFLTIEPDGQVTEERLAGRILQLIVKLVLTTAQNLNGFETVVLKGNCQGTSVQCILHVEMAGLEDYVQHFFQRPVG